MDNTLNNTKEIKESHPKGLYLLYFTEMWERFSYYGMRAIFTLYMINALLFDKAFASKIYGSYTGLVYLTPLLGGYIADKYWGNRRSIIFGGALMAVGQFFMFLSGNAYQDVETAKLMMFTGLGFLIFGNGFFKPNISTMVGQLYPEGDRRVDSAFTIFYQGINMGALLAPAVCGALGEQYDSTGLIIPSAFKWGFLAACIGMIISLISFVLLKNKYIKTPSGEAVGMPPKNAYNRQLDVDKPSAKLSPVKIFAGVGVLFGLFILFYQVLGLDTIGSIIFSSCIVLPALIISDPSLTKIEKDRIWVIFIIAFFVIFFWSAFEQAGASLTFFAQEQTNRLIIYPRFIGQVLGFFVALKEFLIGNGFEIKVVENWNMPASLFQIFNALFIVILAPVAVAVWTTLGKRNSEPASPVKQSMGLGFLALGYLFIAWGVNGIQPWDKVSMIWLVGLYLIHTIGELCLSPIGLSMVVKLAPARFVSLLMGVWFMSTATANKFAGDLSALYPEEVKLKSSVLAEGNLGQSLQAYQLDTNLFKSSLKDTVRIKQAAFSYNKSGELVGINPAMQEAGISYYQIYLVKAVNKEMAQAVVSEDGRYLAVNRLEKSKDGNVTVEKQKVEVWDLKPVKPKFLGMQIKNLFDFFMIFVYMAGASAILLFSIRNVLFKLMHGIK